METLALHPKTKQQLQHFAARPSHALLLTGADGIGKFACAQALLLQILQLDMPTLTRHPYIRFIEPDERNTLSIDTVRQLQRFLQLRTTGGGTLRRAVIIAHADTLTTEAQNAFLKILEEPPADTLLILTAHNVRSLLPTIRSRMQSIVVREPAETEVKAFFAGAGKETALISRAYSLSGGLPGLMHALLDGESHPLMESVVQAKQVLGAATFERLASVDSYAKQRDSALLLLQALLCIGNAGMNQATAKGEATRIRQWHHIRKETVAAHEALTRSASPKLVLTNLMLRI